MANDEITEKIIFCTERLESAFYYEDKEETLQILLDMCPENATKIGVYSINTIISSMQKSHSVFLQYKLLNAILSTEHREEFLDIILKSDQNVITIYTNLKNFKSVCKQLAVKNGYRVYKILSASNMLLLFIDNITCCVEYLKYLIYEENIQFFVFNGLFEQLLSLINDSNYNACISTIERMLKCSLQAQNYFMELKWKTMLGEYNLNKICTALLDKRNTNFVNVQNYVIKEDLLDCNDFHFTNALIYKNINAFLYAESKGLNAELILNKIYSDDNLVVSYNLLAQFAKYKEIPLSDINEEDSHFYAILCILLVVNDNYNDLKGYIDNAQLALLQYKSTEARLLESAIVFIVLMTDALLHVYLVKEMLNDAELSVVYKSLLALAVCSKNIEKELLMINNELLLDYLCILRHNLVNDKLECADVVKENLLRVLGAEIAKLNENMVHEEIVRNELKEEEIVMAKTEETVVQEDKIEIDKITNYKKTLTKLFSVQKEVEEESGDDVYDL